jgi:hypothetical protein
MKFPAWVTAFTVSSRSIKINCQEVKDKPKPPNSFPASFIYQRF